MNTLPKAPVIEGLHVLDERFTRDTTLVEIVDVQIVIQARVILAIRPAGSEHEPSVTEPVGGGVPAIGIPTVKKSHTAFFVSGLEPIGRQPVAVLVTNDER